MNQEILERTRKILEIWITATMINFSDMNAY